MKSIKRTVAHSSFQFGILFFLVLGINSGGVVAAPLVGCLDTRGCPDLTAFATEQRIEEVTFSDSDCAFLEGEVADTGLRRLLRFTFTSPNKGRGDIIIGAPDEHPELFDFDTCHGHPHFKEFADYRLWTISGYQTWNRLRAKNPGLLASEILAAHPELESELVTGGKRGFCMTDDDHFQPRRGPVDAVYNSCTDNQGISVGWDDVYEFSLDGQWVDITELPSGSYILEVEVNAGHIFEESNYRNNRKAVRVSI